MKKCITAFSLGLSYLFSPQVVFAHSFGKLYNLPVPFWLYVYGGVTTLIISFLIIGYFFTNTKIKLEYKKILLSKWPIFRVVTSRITLYLVQIFSIFLFGLTILSGFIGRDLALTNINMTLFWIIFVLGVMYASAFIGDIYSVLNPFRIITECVERFLGIKINGLFKYPPSWGYYPALFLYFLFIWLELFGSTTPLSLSYLLVIYTIVTFMGIVLFGKSQWLTRGEFFGVLFQLIGKMAFIEYVKGKFYFRPPFLALLKEKAQHSSLLLFVLFMLSSTAFDGLRETTFWYRFQQNIFLRSGEITSTFFDTVGLFLSPIFFLVAYIFFVWLAKLLTQSKLSLKELAMTFTYSLIPIAFVYNVAHYYTLLLTEGSKILSRASDPFGYGWDLFGTVQWKGIQVVDATIVWHTQVIVILVGHITGVFLSHFIALRLFPSHKKALLSQFPMLFLMVIYTMAGLWILSQPIAPVR